MKLADIVRIDSGYHFRGRIENDPERLYVYTNPKHLANGTFGD
jgi:hypothetical protein